jgi:hypothetical protein
VSCLGIKMSGVPSITTDYGVLRCKRATSAATGCRHDRPDTVSGSVRLHVCIYIYIYVLFSVSTSCVMIFTLLHQTPYFIIILKLYQYYNNIITVACNMYSINRNNDVLSYLRICAAACVCVICTYRTFWKPAA